ncbi:MAG: metal-dependent hydrolase [Lachnospiraceae bacterium]|nr:metal-dependent hydrolase [Robinsoniella sp.]MDY3767810.1 metal-dependent hydrolase [Lachnospiraceae bacterium]
MLGKTHLVIGETAALAVLQPSGWREVALCLGAAAVGSVICDIDAENSHARKNVNRMILVSIFALVVLGIAEWKLDLGIAQKIMEERDLFVRAAGLVGFLVMCIIGKRQPHRGFMHSVLATVIFSGLVYVMLPKAAYYFAVAMSSHLVLDLFNKKNLSLWFPFPGGVSLKICKADGWTNQTLFYIGCAAMVVLTLIALFR